MEKKLNWLFSIVTMRGSLVHKTSLTPQLFTEVPVLSQESEQSCICVY